MATEILNREHRNSVRIKRQEQVSYFNVSLFGEQKNFLHEIMGKIEASVFQLPVIYDCK